MCPYTNNNLPKIHIMIIIFLLFLYQSCQKRAHTILHKLMKMLLIKLIKNYDNSSTEQRMWVNRRECMANAASIMFKWHVLRVHKIYTDTPCMHNIKKKTHTHIHIVNLKQFTDTGTHTHNAGLRWAIKCICKRCFGSSKRTRSQSI